MDPELEAFVPFLPETDWADPPAARKIYAELAASRPAPDLAKITLIGRIAAEPKVRTTKNDREYLTYTVATGDPVRGGVSTTPSSGSSLSTPPLALEQRGRADGKKKIVVPEPPQQTTSFHTIFAYGPAVERLKTLPKGCVVSVARLAPLILS